MKLGEKLQLEQRITQQQLEQALDVQQQAESQDKLGDVLVGLGYVTEEHVISALVLTHSIPLLSPIGAVPRELTELIPSSVCNTYTLIPVDRVGSQFVIAMADPLDQDVCQHLAAFLPAGSWIRPVFATKPDIEQAIRLSFPREPRRLLL